MAKAMIVEDTVYTFRQEPLQSSELMMVKSCY